MDRYTRWSALLDLLAGRERLSVEEAATELGISAATVRRDFDSLARSRKLLRVRGAAVHLAAPIAHPLLDVEASSIAGPPEGRRVAAEAVRLLRQGSVAGLTGGALTRVLARAIGRRFDAARPLEGAQPQSPASSALLTVVTNDLVAAADLARRSSLKIVATGGVLDGSAHLLGGPLAGLLLQGVSLDTALIAADAVDPEFGVTAADEDDAGVAAAMVARARQVIVVAVSADLDRSAFARVCDTARIDVLVTDAGIAPATAERFRNRGVRIVVA